MGFASLSEVIPAPGSAVIGSALPLRRRLAPRPWGLPDHRRVRSFENGRSASPRVGPPSEYDRVSCRCPVGQRRLPWSFSPLQRIRIREPTDPGFASSRFWCGYRVSHPLAAFLLPRPSDRLGSVTLMGLPPPKLSPPTEPRRLSAPVALLPLAVRTVGVAPGATSRSGPPRLQGFAPRGSPWRKSGG
jgi:hypothetical protein